jgi:endonuclease/exonuclease/phosphatase family metal-dependent hydrolase
MTWNVYGQPEKTFQFINKWKPDIIGINEAGMEGEIKKHFRKSYLYFNFKQQFPMGIISSLKALKYEIYKSEGLHKCFIFNRYRINGKEISIFLVHFIGNAYPERQLNEAKQLLSYIKKKTDFRNVIVLGDFNSKSCFDGEKNGIEILNFFYQAGFHDAWKVYHQSEVIPTKLERSNKDKRIDFILISSDIKIHLRNAGIHLTDSSISDHRAVWAEFDFKNAEDMKGSQKESDALLSEIVSQIENVSEIHNGKILKILSHNLFWQQGYPYMDKNPQAVKIQIHKALLNIYNLLSPDIFCFQEVQDESSAVLLNKSLMGLRMAYTPGQLQPQYGGCIITKIPAEISDWRDWQITKKLFQRMSMIAALPDGTKIANIHLPSGTNIPEGKLIQSKLSQLDSTLNEGPDIVVGDFNETMHDLTGSYLCSKGYVHASSLCKGSQMITTVVNNNSIDHAWIKESLSDRVLLYKIFPISTLRYFYRKIKRTFISDHVPLLLILKNKP